MGLKWAQGFLTWNSKSLAFNTETIVHAIVIVPQGFFLDIIYPSRHSQDRNYSLDVGYPRKASQLSDAAGDSFITCCW